MSEEELHQMASIGRLLTGIVHEINTPIGSIFSNNEVTKKSLEKAKRLLNDGDLASVQKAVALIDTCLTLLAVDEIACQRIASVIRGLKSFGRVDQNERRPCDLNENLRNTVKLTKTEFRQRIAVEGDYGELPEIECFPQMLNQVFLNILVNAGQAIEGEGKITVRTRYEDGMIHISIADTGKGIPAAARDRVFDAGFTTKAIGVGTGLGLSIARKIVEEEHAGRLALESEVGVGTTFHIYLPVGAPPSGSQ